MAVVVVVVAHCSCCCFSCWLLIEHNRAALGHVVTWPTCWPHAHVVNVLLPAAIREFSF